MLLIVINNFEGEESNFMLICLIKFRIIVMLTGVKLLRIEIIKSKRPAYVYKGDFELKNNSDTTIVDFLLQENRKGNCSFCKRQ
jgi:hypothetical protein